MDGGKAGGGGEKEEHDKSRANRGAVVREAEKHHARQRQVRGKSEEDEAVSAVGLRSRTSWMSSRRPITAVCAAAGSESREEDKSGRLLPLI